MLAKAGYPLYRRSTDVLHWTSASFAEEQAVSATTIRLPDELKERVARAAERAGTTPHAFILDANAERVDDEPRNDLHATAEGRYAEIVSTGKTIPWSAMRAYLEDRLSGSKSSRPAARKLTQ